MRYVAQSVQAGREGDLAVLAVPADGCACVHLDMAAKQRCSLTVYK